MYFTTLPDHTAPGFALARIVVALLLMVHSIYRIAEGHVHGWFVVGGGTDGMEYSVLLITCLSAVAWSYWPRKS